MARSESVIPGGLADLLRYFEDGVRESSCAPTHEQIVQFTGALRDGATHLLEDSLLSFSALSRNRLHSGLDLLWVA